MTKLIKNRDGNFTHVKNDIFESGLSAKAMGLFCYLWHLPDDWQFYEDEIVKHFQDGKTSIRTGIQELENAGFIERKQQRDSKGLFSKYDWVLHEKPILDNRKSENPKSQKRKSDNETLQSTNSTKYSSNQVLSSSSGGFKEQPEITAIDAWTNNWEYPNVINRDDIFRWVNDVGNELVCLAIETAGHNNVSSRGAYRYVKKVIEEWKNRGIDTVEKAKNQIAEHENKNDRENHPQRSYKSKSKEQQGATFKPGDYTEAKKRLENNELPF